LRVHWIAGFYAEIEDDIAYYSFHTGTGKLSTFCMVPQCFLVRLSASH